VGIVLAAANFSLLSSLQLFMTMSDVNLNSFTLEGGFDLLTNGSLAILPLSLDLKISLHR
jgi:hypothetical protein